MLRVNRVSFVSLKVFFICCFMVSLVGYPFLLLYLLFGCFLHSLGESLVHDWRLDLLWYFSFLCSLPAGPLLAVDSPSCGMLQLPCKLGVFVYLTSKTFYYKLLLSSRCSISAKRAVLAYDCSWLSLAACVTNIESVLAAYSSYQSACMYKSFSSCKSFPILLPDGSQVYCTVSSDAFCKSMVIEWSDYLVGSCILNSLEFTWLTSCKMIMT